MGDELTRSEVDRALAGDESAQTRLVDALTPVIQARVARGLMLWRRGPAARRNIAQEVEDLTHEIFLALFMDDCKVIRGWQPERGLSLEKFVGIVAERQAASILRSGKRSPWKEDPTLTEELDQRAPQVSPEESTASREEVEILLDRLKDEIDPNGWHLFDMLFLQTLSMQEIARQTGMTTKAIYTRRSRLRALARKLRNDIRGDVIARRRKKSRSDCEETHKGKGR